MKETKFKNTEIGVIPEEWEMGYFGDVLSTFSAGATPYRGIPDYYNGKINWISSGELNYNVIYDTIEHISEEALRNTNLCLHAPGTFLMAITGLEAAGTRGRCAFVGVPSATNQSCLAINGTNKMDIKYLYWYYRMYGDSLAFKYSQGTKQQSYTATIVKNLPIIYPKQVVEQRRIASALTSIDNLISSLGKLIEKKKNIKQGAMQQLLTGKIRLKGFDEPWNKCCLSKICNDIFSGKNTTHSNSGMFSVYGSTGIIGYTDTYKYDYPTILVARVGANAGTVNKAVDCYDVSDNTLIISLKPNQNIDLLTYILKYKKLNSMIFGSGQPLITGSQLKSLTIEIPVTIAEQQAIATILIKMDNEITALEAKKDKYEAIKQGMMQQLLTGKIRLIS